MLKPAVSVLVLVFASGCVATTQVDGHTLAADQWTKDHQDIQRRAGFELHCPVEQSELTVLATTPHVQGSSEDASQVGVSACGHDAVYVRAPLSGQWVLNSTDAR
jgi:hypothetical protein